MIDRTPEQAAIMALLDRIEALERDVRRLQINAALRQEDAATQKGPRPIRIGKTGAGALPLAARVRQ